MIGQATAHGFQTAWRARSPLLFLLIINFLLSSLFIHPYISNFKHFFSHSGVTHILAKHSYYSYLKEFYHYKADSVQASMATIRLGLLLNFLLSIFFAGGIVSYFQKDRRNYVLRQFLSESAQYVGRMLRIVFLSLGLWVVGIAFFLLTEYIIKFFQARTTPMSLRFYLLVAQLIIFALLLNIVYLLIDYTKIFLVKFESKSVLRAFGQALYFFRRFLVKTYLLHLIIALFSTFIWFVHISILYLLPEDRTSMAYLSWLVLQIFIYIRWWVKWSFIGAQTKFLELVTTSPEN